jgi:hypothetical protein
LPTKRCPPTSTDKDENNCCMIFTAWGKARIARVEQTGSW